MYRKIWKKSSSKLILIGERNLQVVLDVAVDMFFLLVPLVVIYFIFGVQISIPECLEIVIVPSLSLITKLPNVFEEIIISHINDDIEKKLDKKSDSFKRNRISLFGVSVNENILQRQNKNFPRYAKQAAFSISLIYVAFLVVLSIRQFGTMFSTAFATKCNEEVFKTKYSLWNKGCKIKIPYCKRISPKCNCALLDIQNEINLTRLP